MGPGGQIEIRPVSKVLDASHVRPQAGRYRGDAAAPATRPRVISSEPPETREDAAVDTRSDSYGLGATVYALLTGRPPFEGSSLVETLTKIRSAEPTRPTKYQLAIPGLFEGAVLKMLAKRPEDRFQTPSELLKDLERVAKTNGIALPAS